MLRKFLHFFYATHEFPLALPAKLGKLPLLHVARTQLSISILGSNGVHAIPARVIATCFALACFAGSALVGLYHGNPALSIVISSFFAMIAAYLVGLIVGAVAQHAVDDHVRRHKANHPLPGDEAELDPTELSATATGSRG